LIENSIGAFRELLAKAVMEIRKHAFGDDTEDAKSIPWTGVQFWKVMVELAKHENVSA
jgi:hypothetical protein